MFQIPSFDAAPPASIAEAMIQAERLLHLAGLNEATLSVARPPEAGEALRGACLEASIPVRALEVIAGKTLDSMAASQGVKISDTRLSLENGATGALSLKLGVEVDVRVFGKTVTVRVQGVAEGGDGKGIVFRQLTMDAGSGIFAGMATALLRPRLDALEGRRFEFTAIAGIPVSLERLERVHLPAETVHIGLRFE